MGCRQVQRGSIEEARAAGDGEATEWNVVRTSFDRGRRLSDPPILPPCVWLARVRNFFQHAREEGMLHCGFLHFRFPLNTVCGSCPQLNIEQGRADSSDCMGTTYPEYDKDDRYTTNTGVRSLFSPAGWSVRQLPATEQGGETENGWL